MKPLECVEARHLQSEVVKADGIVPIERAGIFGILRLPQGQHNLAIAEKYGRVGRLFPDLLKTERIDKEMPSAVQVGNRKPDVVNALRAAPSIATAR